jgi:hypothetical protein
MGWVKRWAKGRQGICSIALSVLVVAGSAKVGIINPFTVPFVALALLPVAGAVVWLIAAIWEDQSLPATPRFARPQPASASRQLRDDSNAAIWTDRLGFLFAPRLFFIGTGCPPVRLKADFAEECRMRQGSTPVLIASTSSRRYWWYRDAFYWENQELTARDVMALLHDRDRRHGRSLDRAKVLLDVEQGLATPPARQRQPVPRAVREAVFSRDGGRCVECQSNFDIQYDHVIPWSLGGADTVQNLQILCAQCNARKGASF